MINQAHCHADYVQLASENQKQQETEIRPIKKVQFEEDLKS